MILGTAAIGMPIPATLRALRRVSTQAHTLPSEEPAATVVYACDARSVSLTMVNGHVLYENGQLTTLDETALRAESRRERARLFRRAGITG